MNFKDIHTKFHGFLKKTKSNNQKILNDVKNIILILASSFVFMILWVNRINFLPENIILWAQEKIFSIGFLDSFPCKIDGEKILSKNFQIYDKNIYALSDTSLSIINSKGKIVRKSKHNFSNPCLKISGIRQIIYDIGGKNYKLESFCKTLFEGKTDKKIISCAVSETGSFAIITESVNHLSELTVYNKSHAEKYHYYFSDIYVTDVCLNSFATKAFISGISTENGEITSEIYVLDFTSEIPEHKIKLSNNTCTTLNILSNENLLAIGDKYMSFINTKNYTNKNLEYNNKILKFYDFSKDYGICCCLTPSVADNESDEIISVDIAGNEITKLDTEVGLRSISQRKNRIIGVSADKLYSYSISSKLEGTMPVKHHLKKIILLPNSTMYTLRGTTIDKIKINLNKK
ncbi:MAG: DUF5711 family protein [Acutalibacteraceae bacterium]